LFGVKSFLTPEMCILFLCCLLFIVYKQSFRFIVTSTFLLFSF
jgi:hypothetical protein